ncbi:sensor histidine kinase [Actimicrobium sp. CCI2.3]|uniref:sensor histidine kinase n=1 Tax=Actimicrobium sp. CCI2.3 TaxID=3048616 RepID=UPI002AB5C5D4|nr:ATP-binding protein [Actimicrobium sp. CCI2.3]MDY7576404.1 ATP-binding protein [Actimicrobium sp. CCI2.3]MEB0024071.1 ATP-binding protein [Actimicrobium sp. CCI2.3]
MGKLFGKFFFFILLAQLTAALGIGGAVWLSHHQRDAANLSDQSPPAAFSLEAAAAVLHFGGTGALQQLASHMGPHPVYSVDAAGVDVAGRTVPPALLKSAYARLRDAPAGTGARDVVAPDGQHYVMFAAAHARHGEAGPAREEGLRALSLLLAATLASLLFAALLARYFFRPIRLLRDAFGAAAAGDLQPRLQQTMGRRRDALADLGGDFDRMAQRLRTLMDGQRRLLHHVSHELRSPLARQQIAIGLARQQPERIVALLARIERDGQRMDQLIGAVLALSRLESGIDTAGHDDVPLDAMLADIVTDAGFEGAPEHKQVVLIAAARVTIRGNPALLHSAFENIVRNAIKHNLPGGMVGVHVTTSATQVRVTVCDNGPGVPEDDLAAIFEPFYRSGERSVEGHGLGLAIARQVIDAHDGSIVADNRTEGGLRVTICLPLA